MTHTDQCARMRPVKTHDPVRFNPYNCYRRLQWAGIVAQTRWTGYNVVTVIAGPKTHLYMSAREFADLVMEALAPLQPRLLHVGNWTVDITPDATPNAIPNTAASRCQPRVTVRKEVLRLVSTLPHPTSHTTRKED